MDVMSVGHTFACDECGAEAGRVTVYAAGEVIPVGPDAGVQREIDNAMIQNARLVAETDDIGVTFLDFGNAAALAALGAGDAEALYAAEREFAPFWCPRCRASYCSQHWVVWDVYDDGFFEEKRGRCLKGHERMLID